LVVDRKIELLFLLIIIPIRQIVELDFLLNGNLFLIQTDHVGLIDNELTLPYFIAFDKIFVIFDDMSVRLLLAWSPGALLNQSEIMILVSKKDGIIEGKHFKVYDYFVD